MCEDLIHHWIGYIAEYLCYIIDEAIVYLANVRDRILENHPFGYIWHLI